MSKKVKALILALLLALSLALGSTSMGSSPVRAEGCTNPSSGCPG